MPNPRHEAEPLKHVGFKATDQEIDALKTLASERGITTSRLMRLIVQSYLKEK